MSICRDVTPSYTLPSLAVYMLCLTNCNFMFQIITVNIKFTIQIVTVTAGVIVL